MEKIIRFKKNWEESFIRINMVDGCMVEIDTPLYSFEKRFKELLSLPSVWWRRKKTADKMIREAVFDAFETTIKEMKEETKKI